MLTYLTTYGTWRASRVGGVLGNNYIPNVSCSALWICPPPNSTVITKTVDGKITTSAKNKFGERDCYHSYGDGELFSVGGDNIVTSTIEPFPGKAPIPLTTVRLRKGGTLVKESFVGPTFTDSLNFVQTIPDHTVGSYDYRNCVITYSTLSTNTFRVERRSQYRYMGQIWKDSLSDSTFQVDPLTCKYRYKYTSSWSKWFPADTMYLTADPSNCSQGISIPDDFERASFTLARLFVPKSTQVFGDLAIRCAEDARSIDMNSIEYLRDFGRFFSDVKDIRALLGKKSSLKKFSEMYLTYKYGPGLTVSDTLDLLQLMQHFTLKKPKDYSWVRASESITDSSGSMKKTTDFHYKVRYCRSSDELNNLIGSVQSVGLLPTPKSIWELIPLSFVVDWFIPLSDILSAGDAQITWETHHVMDTVSSEKRVYGALDLKLFGIRGYAGGMSIVDYSRWTSPYVALPQYFSDAPSSFSNYPELTALIIAMKR